MKDQDPPESELRILLADDNIINQRVGLLILDHLGYHADVAVNGQEVLDAMERIAYDVILMDVQMPEMDGLKVTRRIRARTDLWQPRIVALTAATHTRDRDKCDAAGMDDFVAKPVRRKELAAALDRAVAIVSSPPNGEPDIGGNPSEWVAPTAAVDLSVLATLLSSLGDRAPMAEFRLIDTYLGELPRLVGQLYEALQRGDRESLHRAAHILKASSANMGALRLSQMCADLEVRTQDAIPPDADTSIRHIVGEQDGVARAFRRRHRHLSG